MGVLTFKKGEEIIKEGSIGSSAYMIISGKVEVSGLAKGKKVVFAILGEKEIFGEMGLIEDKARSATVTAIVETELNEITREDFNELFQKDPKVILPIVKVLFERLRSATRMAVANINAANTANNNEQDIKDEKVIDERYLLFSGETEFAKQALEYSELEIKKFPFKVGGYALGYNDVLSDNDFIIKEDSPPYYVSRNHFLIDKVAGNFVIVDRGSRLGVLVNERRIEEPYVLKDEKTNVIIGSIYSPFSFTISVKGKIKTVTPKESKDKPKTVEKKYEAVK